ncbi:hypothetical protein RFI_06276 [Reticulomyxa filosa]|uniref:PPIase cyclophilin-type domain-containing protein n=1 Tax=Reticulomyxa filosa TaxID=46433 RepID=X6NWZ5_RETFI|nr:hypothetical protein RFI_06276 [Reticulomyxa filosa]|eukprot:ETO30840.1 hypothetical protein RFI_06276 [Reticulomyxa filosa]
MTNSVTKLPPLPTKLSCSQCVFWKDEILICGGLSSEECYSYNIKKEQYKEICEYPPDTDLYFHVVVQVEHINKREDSDTLTLLSFGGGSAEDGEGFVESKKHTMMMKYKSVWKENEKTSKHKNEWTTIFQNTVFGKEGNFVRARAVISGTHNNLLFITHKPHTINVLDLNTYKFVENVNNNILPINSDLSCHCFVALPKQKRSRDCNDSDDVCEFIFMDENVHLLLTYHEISKTFVLRKLPVCLLFIGCLDYSYVLVNDHILFFGGYDSWSRKYKDGVTIVPPFWPFTMVFPLFMSSVADFNTLENKHTTPFHAEISLGSVFPFFVCVHALLHRYTDTRSITQHGHNTVHKMGTEYITQNKVFIYIFAVFSLALSVFCENFHFPKLIHPFKASFSFSFLIIVHFSFSCCFSALPNNCKKKTQSPSCCFCFNVQSLDIYDYFAARVSPCQGAASSFTKTFMKSPLFPYDGSDKEKSTNWPRWYQLVIVIQCVALIGALLTTSIYYTHSNDNSAMANDKANENGSGANLYVQNKNEVRQLSLKMEAITAALKQKESEVQRNLETIRQLTDEVNELRQNSKDNGNEDEAHDEADSNKRLHALFSSLAKTDMYLSELQYHTLNPNGEVTVQINTRFGIIEIEMAPFNIMPHTTRYFLQMIASGFWNGCHFFRNANHVIQANCHHRCVACSFQMCCVVCKENAQAKVFFWIGTNGRHEYEPSISFQEYSEEYVHKPFTVGIAGRPGGPDFYINLVDNIRNHGPGGQDGEADPCFGKIVKGMEVIHHIQSLPKKPNDPLEVLVDEEWVEILSATVHVKNQ